MRNLVAGVAIPAVLGCVIVLLIRAPQAGMAAVVMVGLICLAVIARMSVAQFGAGFIVAFAFTASWDQVEFSGSNVRVIFLAVGVVLLLVVQGAKGLPRIPWWIHCFGVAAIAVTALQAIFPVPAEYMNSRYLTSEAGVALGTRPAVWRALVYLLFNVYVVPFGVALAAVVVPRSLRWIVVAFVGGVAMSGLAGYLGFIGIDWLADLLVNPFPEGLRAVGYTNHPLHLATSCVMALGLAVWVAVQRPPLLAWFGRVCVVAIVLGLYASGSRAGNVSGALMLAACVALVPNVRRRGRVVFSLVAATVGFVSLLAPALLATILRTTRIVGGEDSVISNKGRGELYEQAMTDFGQSPIYGIGTRFIAEAHILYVGILAGGGVILFLAYIVFNVGSFRAVLKAQVVDRPMAGAILATLVASLAYWTAGDEFTVAAAQIVYGILIAIPISQTVPTGPMEMSTSPVSRSHHAVG